MIARALGIKLRREAVLAIVIAMTFIGCAHTPPLRDPSGARLSGSIAEFDRVRMSDGLEELVLVRGMKAEAPLIIFVHGGPGSSELPFFRYYCSALERDFVVIVWEQRGAGKLFDKSKLPSPPTIERHIQDLREIVAWAANRFPGRKPSLVCHSWGSYLGMVYASRYPRTIERYIGSGQEVRASDSERLSRAVLLERAAKDGKAGNARALKELRALDEGYAYGDPADPRAIAKVKVERGWNLRYGGEIYGARDYGVVAKAILGTSEYSVFDYLRYGLASNYSLNALWRDFLATDLSREATRIDVPVFFLQGRHDLTANSSLVRPYFDSLEAPRKELVWFENSAHLPMYEESERWCSEVARVMALRTDS